MSDWPCWSREEVCMSVCKLGGGFGGFDGLSLVKIWCVYRCFKVKHDKN
jgi:hypothetical protein